MLAALLTTLLTATRPKVNPLNFMGFPAIAPKKTVNKHGQAGL
jgi:hypothetical protein